MPGWYTAARLVAWWLCAAVKVVLFLLAACVVVLAWPDLLEVWSVRLLEMALGSLVVLTAVGGRL
jgi:hypothetical protein